MRLIDKRVSGGSMSLARILIALEPVPIEGPTPGLISKLRSGNNE